MYDLYVNLAITLAKLSSDILTKLESKKYEFAVNGTMPVLEFQLNADKQREDLHLELYNPLSNEIFEAKFAKGRIELDRDGSLTYFSQKADHVNVSLFVGKNIQILLTREGELTIKTPSKILSVEQDLESRTKEGPTSDRIKLRLD